MESKDENQGLDFEANLARFKEKMSHIHQEYHKALGWLYVYRQIQDQRKRLGNRAIQMAEGKRVFWGSVLQADTLAPMHANLVAAAGAIEENEEWAQKELHKAMRKTSWFIDVAIPASKGVGMSETGGTLTAAKILDAYGSVKRFGTIGQFMRYSRLAPENGKAPKRTPGQRIKYNPKAFQALFDLTDSWNRMPDCHWRIRWDYWKIYYRDKYPDVKTHPQGRIHNMGRRKVMREFLHELWDLWMVWEDQQVS